MSDGRSLEMNKALGCGRSGTSTSSSGSRLTPSQKLYLGRIQRVQDWRVIRFERAEELYWEAGIFKYGFIIAIPRGPLAMASRSLIFRMQ